MSRWERAAKRCELLRLLIGAHARLWLFEGSSLVAREALEASVRQGWRALLNMGDS